MRRRVLNKDVARALGISESMVSRHAKAGMPTHDLELARKWYDANVTPALRKDTRTPPLRLVAAEKNRETHVPTQGERARAPASEEDVFAIRRRRELAEAELAELQLQERKGALVNRADEAKKGAALASGIVLQLEAIPDRIAAEIGVDDAQRRKIRQRLAEELDRVRQAFAEASLA
jgi:hypothetical protein